MSAIDAANKVFRRVKAANSHLKMEIEEEPAHLNLAMAIKKQPGLNFDVYLNLQNGDELHFQLGGFFWAQWFSCTDATNALKYETAINGVLSGAYRVKAIHRRGVPVKAFLQAPDGDEWVTVFTWGKLHLPIGAITISYIQNC